MTRSLRIGLGCVLTAAILSLSATAISACQDEPEDADELFRQAVGEMQAQDFTEAALLFRKVVKLQADNGRAWQLLGYSLHSDRKLDAAIEVHKKTTEFPEFRGIALFNLGCAYSLKKDADASFEHLTKAVEAGFDGLDYYEDDTDLNYVRKDPRFVALMKKIKGEETDGVKVEQLLGTWNYTSGMRAGEKVDQDRLAGDVKITKETFTIPAGPDSEFVMNYKLDTKMSPATIDLEIKSGPVNEGKALGILKLEKGVLTLCYDPQGQKRPTEFESTQANGFFMFSLKLAKDKADEEADK